MPIHQKKKKPWVLSKKLLITMGIYSLPLKLREPLFLGGHYAYYASIFVISILLV